MGYKGKNKRSRFSGQSALAGPSNSSPLQEHRRTDQIDGPPQQSTRRSAAVATATPQATGHSAAAANPQASGSASTSTQDHVQESSETNQDLAQKLNEMRRKELQARLDEIKKLADVWDIIHENNKKKFLEINIADLRNYLKRAYSTSENLVSLIRIFNEAIHYVSKKNKNCLEVFLCPHCKHPPMKSAEIQLKHVLEKHSTRRSMGVDKDDIGVILEWVRMVKYGKWEPVDIDQAYPIIKALKPNCSTEDIMNQKWPTYQDPYISRLLKQVRNMFRKLIWEEGCLAPSNIATAMDYSMHSIKHILSDQHLIDKMANVHIPICCLTKNRLESLLDYFHGLYDACDSIQYPDKISRFLRALSEAEEMQVKALKKANEMQVEESLAFLDQEKPVLLLDESVINQTSIAYIQWLRNGTTTDAWEQWQQLKGDKISLVTDFLQAYESTSELLKTLIETRDHIKAVHQSSSSVQTMCDAELELRNGVSEWNKCDARIMRIYSVIDNFMRRFKQLPGLDYRAFLLPLIKSFLKERLENLAAKEKTSEGTLDSDFQTALKEVRAEMSASASASISQQGSNI